MFVGWKSMILRANLFIGKVVSRFFTYKEAIRMNKNKKDLKSFQAKETVVLTFHD